MSYGILLLRLVLGLTMAGHGTQKLFGWWGGPGLRGTAGSFAAMHFRAPLAQAALASSAELGGGVLLALGLVTPLGALAITSVMLVAIATVHWSKGFWNSGGGYEFGLLIAAAAVALAVTGGDRFSLDRALGWSGSLSGLWWGAGVLAAAALAAAATVTLGRRPAQPAPHRDQPLRTA